MKPGMKGRFATKRAPDGAAYVAPVGGEGGEEYAINCPVCKETRQRCYINYMYGAHIQGLPVFGAVHCFNGHCENKGLARVVRDMLDKHAYTYTPPSGDGATVSSTPSEDIEDVVGRMSSGAYWPKETKLLSELPANHPMVEYVKSRGLDPNYLSASYGVAHADGKVRGKFRRRLVVPIHCLGRYVGCLGRALPGWTPLVVKDQNKKWPYTVGKYVNSPGLSTSRIFYNYDAAAKHDVIVVTEGVMDVWKIGPWAVAMCKAVISPSQVALLVRACTGREPPWLVLLGEPESEKDWMNNLFRLQEAYPAPDKIRLRMFRKGDAGDFSPTENGEIIKGALNGPVTGYV